MYRKETGHAKNILKSGIEISELGLGCMSLGTDYKKRNQLLKVQLIMVLRILILQIFTIKGVNEEIVGKALKISKS